MLLIAAILKVTVPVELGDTVPAADVAQMVEALLEVCIFVFQSFESVSTYARYGVNIENRTESIKMSLNIKQLSLMDL